MGTVYTFLIQMIFFLKYVGWFTIPITKIPRETNPPRRCKRAAFGRFRWRFLRREEIGKHLGGLRTIMLGREFWYEEALEWTPPSALELCLCSKWEVQGIPVEGCLIWFTEALRFVLLFCMLFTQSVSSFFSQPC